MRRGRTFILLALILLVGAVGAFVFLSGGIGGGGEPEATPAPTPIGEAEIVIAAQHISRGSIIPPEAVIISPFPADYKVETMLDDPVQVIGKRARMDIGRGVPITENMITETAGDLLNIGSDAAIAIPEGFTAIAVPLNRFSGVAYAMRQGDQVDVLVSILILDIDQEFQSELPNEAFFLFDTEGSLLSAFSCRAVEIGDAGEFICGSAELPPTIGHLQFDEELQLDFYAGPSERQRPRLVSQRLISNATVLGVGDFPTEAQQAAVQVVAVAAEDQGLGAPEAQAQAQEAAVEQPIIEPPTIITLIVSPQDALSLNWAISGGYPLTLTLRSPNDPTPEIDTDSVTLQYFIDNYNITVPSKLPYGTGPRLVAPDLEWPFDLDADPSSEEG